MMLTSHFGTCIGVKFLPDGGFRPFAGNTVISFLADSSLRGVLDELQTYVLADGRADYLFPLPRESFHMTVFEGVCDQVRTLDHWTARVGLDSPLPEVSKRLYEAFLHAPPFPQVQMDLSYLRIDGAVSIGLHSASSQDDFLIRAYRDSLSSLLGIRFPGHETYAFHIGLAYGRRPATDDDLSFADCKAEVDQMLSKRRITFMVPPPAFCVFADMSGFVPMRG